MSPKRFDHGLWPIRAWCFVLAATLFGLQPVQAANELRGPLEGSVEIGSVRLSYLDWGGKGPALILLHGLGDSPRAFDELAPALVAHFHVIAYARRGSGNSDIKGPYDVGTLTEDLKGLMDALGVRKATLVGWSAAGDEITEMAALHPERVTALVYLDAAYDLSEPEFREVLKGLPGTFFDPPATVTASFDAYRTYQQQLNPSVDIRRMEGSLRDKVVVHTDGTVALRIPKAVVGSLYSAAMGNHRRVYSGVSCPVLAIYTYSLYDLEVADPALRRSYTEYHQKYWKPWQDHSRERLRNEVHDVRIVNIPGVHGTFLFTQQREIVKLLNEFLLRSGH